MFHFQEDATLFFPNLEPNYLPEPQTESKEDLKNYSKFLRQEVIASLFFIQNASTAYNLALDSMSADESMRLFKLAFTHPLILHHPFKIKTASQIALSWPLSLQTEFYNYLEQHSLATADLFKKELLEKQKDNASLNSPF